MTVAIESYPVQLIDVIRLADGRSITLRPSRPRDAEQLRAFFRTLTDGARYFRFMTALRELPEALGKRFDDVDYRSHMALLAEHFDGDRGTIIGEARYIANQDDPGTCEFAIAVADDWQRLGLARALLDRLVSHAAASGIHRMAADTLCANKAMLGLARKAGFSVEPNPQDARLWRLSKTPEDARMRNRNLNP